MRTLTSLFIVLAAAVYAQSYAIKGPSAPKPYEANAMKELGDYLAKRIDGTLTVGGKNISRFRVWEIAADPEAEITELYPDLFDPREIAIDGGEYTLPGAAVAVIEAEL